MALYRWQLTVIRNQKSKMFEYDKYNREERALCAHLFRLLHERLDDKQTSPLGQLIAKLVPLNLIFNNGSANLSTLRYENIGIFSEVAIIRDAYHQKKKENKIKVDLFMDSLTRLIIKQKKVSDCRLYSQVQELFKKDVSIPHPKQIRQKAILEGIRLSENEIKVYGAIQGMFNAKPDLLITIDDKLLTFEAKFTEKFDPDQLKRTENITEVWATLLYEDLGFSQPPQYTVIKLGASSYNPHINWTTILDIAKRTYSENDRTLITLKSGVELLKNSNME